MGRSSGAGDGTGRQNERRRAAPNWSRPAVLKHIPRFLRRSGPDRAVRKPAIFGAPIPRGLIDRCFPDRQLIYGAPSLRRGQDQLGRSLLFEVGMDQIDIPPVLADKWIRRRRRHPSGTQYDKDAERHPPLKRNGNVGKGGIPCQWQRGHDPGIHACKGQRRPFSPPPGPARRAGRWPSANYRWGCTCESTSAERICVSSRSVR